MHYLVLLLINIKFCHVDICNYFCLRVLSCHP